MAKPYLSIIIPVYNGAEDLPLTLIDVDRHLSEQEYSYEIIVVNDGSSDATSKIAQKFDHLIKNLKLIDNPDNQGIGPIVRVAMAATKGNVRVIMNAKNTTPITEFNKMMPRLREGADVLVGSNGYDFICFSEEAAQSIFPLTKTDRWAFNYEIMALAKTLGFKIKRMAPQYKQKINLSLKPLDVARYILEFIKIRWRLRFFSR